MAEPPARTVLIRDELLRRYPYLREGVLPAAGLFAAAPDDPALYPDDRPRRGFLLPVPAPPGYHLGSRFGARLLGVADGRPVEVTIVSPRPDQKGAVASIWIHMAARLATERSGGGPVRPWLVAMASPMGVERGFGAAGRFNPVGIEAMQLARALESRLGRPPTPSARSAAGTSLIVESFLEPLTASLRGDGFLALYQAWEERSGPPVGRSGPIKPVLHVDAHDLWLINGIGPSVPAEQVVATVGELIGQVADLEAQALGADPRSVPWRTLSVQDPMLSLPDTRYAYPCPKCGKLEWLHRVRDSPARLRRYESLACGAELFPPEPVGRASS